MANILENIQVWYNKLEAATDPRTRGWFLLGGPIPVFTICGLYLLIVWLGPKLMKK